MSERQTHILTKLMAKFESREIGVEQFCIRFEHTWNFELQIRNLSSEEYEAFSQLLATVALFSPVPEDHEMYPGYKDELQIRNAVQETKQALVFR